MSHRENRSKSELRRVLLFHLKQNFFMIWWTSKSIASSLYARKSGVGFWITCHSVDYGTQILFLTSVTLLLLVQVSSVFAYATWGGNYRLSSGVHNRYTWYDSTTIDSTLHSYITSARNDWNNTPTHVWFIETTYKPNSVMDIYHGNYYAANLGILGQSHFFVGNTEVDPWTQNYGWTRIWLNAPNFDYLSTYALENDTHGNSYYINQKKSVIAHEMGHVFGLAHVYSIYLLMYPYGDTVRVDWPTQDEINGVNFLYP